MLAHKATHEAKVAAEVIAGRNVVFDARGIPSVAYTSPEIAWVGLDRDRGDNERGMATRSPVPLERLGPRPLHGCSAGLTKLLVEPRPGGCWAPESSARTRAS